MDTLKGGVWLSGILQLLAKLLDLEPPGNEPEIPQPPPMTDAEIRNGKYIENQLEFGDMLFRGVIGEPRINDSGLCYSYNEKNEIFYTIIDPGIIPPEAAL